MRAVCARFWLPPDEPEEVKRVDAALLGDERAAVMRPCEAEWTYSPKGLGVRLWLHAHEDAEAVFTQRFYKLLSKQDEATR